MKPQIGAVAIENVCCFLEHSAVLGVIEMPYCTRTTIQEAKYKYYCLCSTVDETRLERLNNVCAKR